MGAFWGLSAIDVIAFVYFMVAWIGYAPLLRWKGGRLRILATVMVQHRRAWMYSVLGREMRIADAAIMGHIMSTAGFFASTTVVVIGALLGALINFERSIPASSQQWYMIAPRDPFEIKLALILVVAVYAFLSFTWSIRQANFGAVMIGAAPPPPVAPELRARLAASMGNIVTQVAASYDSGMRAYYFALGAITWIAGPILFLLATTGVVTLLLRRQAQSGTALALQEIAAARAEIEKADGKNER